MTLLQRRDPAKHMARFYRLRVQLRLDLAADLLREWGRIGSPGKVRADPYPDTKAAQAAADSIEKLKRRKGYG